MEVSARQNTCSSIVLSRLAPRTESAGARDVVEGRCVFLHATLEKARGRTGGGVWEERLGKHHIIHGHVSSSSATALTLARAVREDPAYSRDKRSVPQVLRSAERKTGTHAWHATW